MVPLRLSTVLLVAVNALALVQGQDDAKPHSTPCMNDVQCGRGFHCDLTGGTSNGKCVSMARNMKGNTEKRSRHSNIRGKRALWKSVGKAGSVGSKAKIVTNGGLGGIVGGTDMNGFSSTGGKKRNTIRALNKNGGNNQIMGALSKVMGKAGKGMDGMKSVGGGIEGILMQFFEDKSLWIRVCRIGDEIKEAFQILQAEENLMATLNNAEFKEKVVNISSLITRFVEEVEDKFMGSGIEEALWGGSKGNDDFADNDMMKEKMRRRIE